MSLTEVWVDGGCVPNPGRGGFGVVVRDGACGLEAYEFVGEQTTNNVCELMAVHWALSWLEVIRKGREGDLTAKVYTDSAYVVGLLTQGWKPKANHALVAELRDMYSALRADVEIIKVPAHSGIPGNERADALATQAIKTGKCWLAPY